MKDNEEREQSSEVTPSGEVSPVKPLGQSAELEFPLEEPDSMGVDSGPPDEKDPLGAEAAPGALGQVKAKVEVCKDESVGKFSKRAFFLSGIQLHSSSTLGSHSFCQRLLFPLPSWVCEWGVAVPM
jgi:hypothetical protein